MKKYFMKSVLGLIFLNISFASAQEISEIMYDPGTAASGNEWIEIYNNTANPINLVTYKLFEGTTIGDPSINLPSSSFYTNPNGNNLEVGGHAVIADSASIFLFNYPEFSGKLFISNISLSNSGKLLEIKSPASITTSSVNYKPQSAANGTGGTLNYINNSWQVYEQTPGASSTLIAITSNNSSGSGTNSTTTNSATTSISTNSTFNNPGSGSSIGSYAAYTSSGSNRFTLGDLKMLVPREINTVVGAETEFFVKNIDNKNSVVSAQTYWSFGDGAEGIGATTTHRYQNVGVYNAFIESQVSNSYGVDMIIVKVENPNIEISDVQDNYVELHNKSNIELNIGRFIIASDQGFFQLSRMFIISANSKVRVDGRVLGFSKLTNVKLMSAYNTFVTRYESKNTNLNFNNQNINLEDINSTNTLPILQNSSSSIQIKNKIIYKNKVKTKIVSNGLDPKQNPKLILSNKNKEVKISETISSSSTSTENNVEKGSTNFAKKWLYWIYE